MHKDTPNEHSKGQSGRPLYISLIMLFCVIVIALLTGFSITRETLYSPFGILSTDRTDPTYYFGLSIYITLGTTLLTSALIRLALTFSK